MNTNKLERLATCCGYQDKIVVCTTFKAYGTTHTVRIGMIPVWKFDDFQGVVEEAERIHKGHEGTVSFHIHTPKRRQRDPEARCTQIVAAAVSIGAEFGVEHISQNTVASRVGCAPSLIRHYYSAAGLLDAVMREAIHPKRPINSIIAYGVATKHPVIMASNIDLRVEALNDAIS